MKWIVALLITFDLAGSALAESCGKSREYILEGFAGDLAMPAAGYQELFKVCVEALTLTNVKDAYVLKDGGVAIIPIRNSLVATAETLAQFCQRFPKGVALFLSSREQIKALTVSLVVMTSSRSATACKQIRGMT